MPWSDPPRIDTSVGAELTRAGHESIGRSMRRARTAAGYTQRGLAARCGIDQAVISRLENGKQQGLSWRRFGCLVGALGGLDAPVPRPWPGLSSLRSVDADDPTP
jgi:hypothetical protein